MRRTTARLYEITHAIRETPWYDVSTKIYLFYGEKMPISFET